jgi:hypothetical protein
VCVCVAQVTDIECVAVDASSRRGCASRYLFTTEAQMRCARCEFARVCLSLLLYYRSTDVFEIDASSRRGCASRYLFTTEAQMRCTRCGTLLLHVYYISK